MNSDPSLCTLILQLTLKFWLIIRNAFLKHCTQNKKIKFNQNREHVVLKHIFNYCTCNKQFIGKGVINTFYIRFYLNTYQWNNIDCDVLLSPVLVTLKLIFILPLLHLSLVIALLKC